MKPNNKANIAALIKRHSKYTDTMVYCAELELLTEELAIEFGLNKIDIKRVVDAQFKMLRNVMSEEGLVKPESKLEDFKSIRLYRLGSFRPSEARFKIIQKNLIEELNKEVNV
jgi:hypothetical protein